MPPKKSKITRNTANKRQQQKIDSLASVPSPAKSSKSKKSPPVSKEKQVSIELPEREKGIIAQVVTETKQTKSSKEENSTGSQVKMTTPFDTKLGYLLETYLYVKSDKHEIW